jgi:hypothetical protein
MGHGYRAHCETAGPAYIYLSDGHVFTKNGTYKIQDVPQSCDSLQIVAILGLLASLHPRLLLGLSDDIVRESASCLNAHG